jgi:hypothetical protein
MGVIDEIEKINDFIRISLPHAHAPASKSIEIFDETVKEIQQTWGDLPPHTPIQIDLESLYQRLYYATHQDDWSGIKSLRDFKWSPWVFWRNDPCLVDHPHFLKNYRRFLAKASPGAIKTLIYVYLRDFPKDRKSLSKVASLIRKSLAESQARLLNVWRERDNNYALFDPSQGPLKLAQIYWQNGQSIEHVSAAFGLTGELAQGRFIKEAYHVTLNTLRNELNHGRADTLAKVLEWSEKDNSLRYQEYRTSLAETLLLPWQERQPDSMVQMQIQSFLLRQYKDPRLHPGNWRGISDNALSVIRRWLAGETVRLFFEVLDRNSQYYDATTRKHWKYRRAFWWAYYEKEYLQEAWFCFASEAKRLANQVVKPEQRNYSSLDGVGVQSNHAVLIMRIAGLIVAEWSHSGKCRIWNENNKTKPKMYQHKYDGPSLKWGSEKIKAHYLEDGITHYSSETGGWQGDVESFIYQHSGIRMSYRDYMPKT